MNAMMVQKQALLHKSSLSISQQRNIAKRYIGEMWKYFTLRYPAFILGLASRPETTVSIDVIQVPSRM